MESLYAAVLGLIEGLTEFLPISSTGHLVLAGHWLDFDGLVGKETADAFDIIIQLAAILAVVVAFPQRFYRLLDFRSREGLSGIRGLTLLAITSIPAGLIGLAAHKRIEELLLKPLPVAAALAAGAVWILAVEYWPRPSRTDSVDRITWKEALSVGLFQCLSLWPGMSRSASTILGGMLSGVDRRAATEYSFFAAVPIMTAATLLKLAKSYHLVMAHPELFAVGFVVSFLSALAAVKFLIHFVGRHTLIPFAWYRLALAGAVLYWMGRGMY